MSARLAALALVAAGCAPAPESPATADPAARDVVSSPEMAASFPQSAFLEKCEDWDKWDKPAPPFELLGDTWYVGTCGISALLVIGGGEHILIDSGVKPRPR